MINDFDSVADHKAENEVVKKELYREARLAFDFEIHSPEEEEGALCLLEKMIFGAVKEHAGHRFGRMGRLVDHFNECSFEPVERYATKAF
jgi:hypothetical protein